MEHDQPTVFVVDDEPAARDSVCALVGSMRLPTESFASAEDFLAAYDKSRPGCLVTDLRMCGLDGLELQQKLLDEGCVLPVIVLTAFADTPTTVRAIQQGAVTLLDKPYQNNELADAIKQALEVDRHRRETGERKEEILQRIGQLTESEREVLDHMVAGRPNKVIANRISASIRTVENRRREVFRKMGTTSVAELVRFVMEVEE